MERSGFAPTREHRTKRHLVDLAQPDHAPAGGQLIASLDVIIPGLPSGRRMIAPREVDEMALTRALHPQSAGPHSRAISETCPPGEGALRREHDYGGVDLPSANMMSRTTHPGADHAGALPRPAKGFALVGPGVTQRSCRLGLVWNPVNLVSLTRAVTTRPLNGSAASSIQ